MGGDLGRAELDYSKRKAEDDLEQLEQSYRVLSNIEQDAESTEEVRNSAAECKTKLEEAMSRLREFLCEVEKALEYEKKQEFLINVSLLIFTLTFCVPVCLTTLHNSSFLSPTYLNPLNGEEKREKKIKSIFISLLHRHCTVALAMGPYFL